MPTETIKKATEISSLISGWGKIFIGVGSLIGGCFFFYYQVQSNESNIKALEIKMLDKDASDSREFEIWGERSDKRYQRAMETADILLNEINKNEKWLIELDRRITYIEGKLDNNK